MSQPATSASLCALLSARCRRVLSLRPLGRQSGVWVSLFVLTAALSDRPVQAQVLPPQTVQQQSTAPLAARLQPDAPEVYEVKPGDTLWDIAGHFLQDPWLWPQLWQENPQVANPDLIYPGDRLRLLFDAQGRPHLERDNGVVRLSPGIRITRYREAVPAIALKRIAPFIERHQVFSPQQIDASGYVLGAQDQRIVAGAGDQIYVRHADAAAEGSRFLVYREQGIYRAPDLHGRTREIGREMKYIATVQLQRREGERSLMRVLQAREEIRPEDRVTLQDLGETPATFYPSAPSRRVQGSIISLLSGVRYGGRHTVVAIDLGRDNRLVPGNVLSIRQQRQPVKDPITGDWLELPSEETGKLMVFRTFKQVSYALVMQADKPIGVGDQLHTPR